MFSVSGSSRSFYVRTADGRPSKISVVRDRRSCARLYDNRAMEFGFVSCNFSRNFVATQLA